MSHRFVELLSTEFLCPPRVIAEALREGIVNPHGFSARYRVAFVDTEALRDGLREALASLPDLGPESRRERLARTLFERRRFGHAYDPRFDFDFWSPELSIREREWLLRTADLVLADLD